MTVTVPRPRTPRLTNEFLANDLEHVFTHTGALWEQMRGARLFITGGTGFFGSWLLETFAFANERLGLGANAVVLTRNLDVFRARARHLVSNPAIRFQDGDVRSFAFPDGRFSHVIHAAGESDVRRAREAPLDVFDTMVDGTRRTLEMARQSGVRRVLLISSGGVYGPQPPELPCIPEEYVGAPDLTSTESSYGEGKRVAELFGHVWAERFGFEFAIARCFAFVGPYMPLDAGFAMGNFIRDGLADKPIVIQGDGTPYRGYLHAADLMVWLWTILLRGRSGRPYNVGSEESVTIRQLAEVVAAVFDPAPQIVIKTKAVPGQPVSRYVPCVRRANDELGLRRTFDLGESIRRTVAVLRSDVTSRR